MSGLAEHTRVTTVILVEPGQDVQKLGWLYLPNALARSLPAQALPQAGRPMPLRMLEEIHEAGFSLNDACRLTAAGVYISPAALGLVSASAYRAKIEITATRSDVPDLLSIMTTLPPFDPAAARYGFTGASLRLQDGRLAQVLYAETDPNDADGAMVAKTGRHLIKIPFREFAAVVREWAGPTHPQAPRLA